LKNINDNVTALEALSRKLFATGILPYYLHVLDKVQGAAHFEVDVPKAQELYRKLRQCLPGYLVPTLVQEQAGALAKMPLI
jgi:L-lysine 2,3-aminomutase